MHTNLEKELLNIINNTYIPKDIEAWKREKLVETIMEEDQIERIEKFDDLVRDIIKFSFVYDRVEIVTYDDPRKLIVGWMDSISGKKWYMNITDIRKRKGIYSEAITSAISTNKGRVKIALALTKIGNMYA